MLDPHVLRSAGTQSTQRFDLNRVCPGRLACCRRHDGDVAISAMGATGPAQHRHRDRMDAGHLYRQCRLDLVLDLGPSMKASTALTLVSEMPPEGRREAFCICTSVAFTKSLDVVPKAAFNRSHQRLCSPSGG